ncbi:MAG: hypothetical protein ABSA65_06060 [Acidimicrobiales bacterium]|jgi:hypothetical protein
MINPSLLEMLAKQRQREILMATRVRPPSSSHPGIRARLGWSLVDLGVRLVLDAHAREAVHWNRAST